MYHFVTRNFFLVITGCAFLVGFAYILPPVLTQRHIEKRGGSFLLTQPEIYRDEFFTYLPRDREIFDGHFPPAGPYANDAPKNLMNPLPPILYSAFLFIFQGDVTTAYLAMQFVFSAVAFLLFYFLGYSMVHSRLWALFLGFVGVFTHYVQKIFYYFDREILSLYVKDFIPFVRTPISKLHLARMDDPLLTMPIFITAILACYIFWRKPKPLTAIVAGIFVGLLSYTYLHHWLLAMMIVAVLFLITLLTQSQDKQRLKNFFLLLSVLTLVLLPYFYNKISVMTGVDGKAYAQRIGLEGGHDMGLRFLFSNAQTQIAHVIYGILLALVYLIYFRWLKNKERGIFFLACALSTLLVGQIPLVIGPFVALSHFMKSSNLIVLILLFNIAYDVHLRFGDRLRKIVAITVIILIAGMVGKKAINVFRFITPPADIIETYSFPKEVLDSWDWIDNNLSHEPTVVSSSLVTSLYLASHTSARPYLPTGFISALPLAELEKRFLTVNKLFNVSPEILQRRFNDFADGFLDRCPNGQCFKQSHFNFTKTRWYLTQHSWHSTTMAKEPQRVLEEYKNAKVAWKQTNAQYVYYGPWERQFGSVDLERDSENLELLYKNDLVEIYRIL